MLMFEKLSGERWINIEQKAHQLAQQLKWIPFTRRNNEII